MTTKNDEVILQLKKQIEEKKKSIKATERFQPVTNCSLELDGIRSNIQVLTKEQLVSLLVKLNSYKKSADELGMLSEYIISGYSIDDWISDVKSKYMNLNRKEEQENLRQKEMRLMQLLSGDKKIELELDEIANSLK
jgi:predicted RNase H-like nuclease (RuvC/YqgF family)